MVRTRELLAAMREATLPQETRRGVRASAADQKRGAVLGYVTQYNKGWTVSVFTRKHPELANLACAYARERFPDFVFTSIMVNEGGSALHIDRANIGPSMIVSLGDHVGGELWQYPDTIIKVHNRLRPCDGLVPHMTMPYRGERFSLVYFNLAGNFPQPERSDARYLRSLGFYKPSDRPDAMGRRPRADLLVDAAAVLRRRGIPAAKIGDYTNASIPSTIYRASRQRT